jgi:hypothetical protein
MHPPHPSIRLSSSLFLPTTTLLILHRRFLFFGSRYFETDF